MMAAYKYLADHLKQARKDRHLTCEEYASELGISKSTLYKLESGKGNFSSSTLEQVSSVLGLPPWKLLSPPDSEGEIPHSLIQTATVFSALSSPKRAGALYHLDCLAELLRPDPQEPPLEDSFSHTLRETPCFQRMLCTCERLPQPREQTRIYRCSRSGLVCVLSGAEQDEELLEYACGPCAQCAYVKRSPE